MQQKTILGAVVVVAFLAGGFTVWEMHSLATTTPATYITYSLIDEKTALAKLQDDAQNVIPRFIGGNMGDGQSALTPEEQRIRDDLVVLYAARYATGLPSSHTQSALVGAQNGVWLNAIGVRYILVTEASKFAIDEILDLQTGQATPISHKPEQTKRYYFAPERNIALYIDNQALYTYSLDQATTTLVTESQLSGSETYHNGFVDGIGIGINPKETHTKNSITISVFDSSKKVPNPEVPGATMYAKVGQKTLSF